MSKVHIDPATLTRIEQTAALVRTVALVEILFAQAISRKL